MVAHTCGPKLPWRLRWGGLLEPKMGRLRWAVIVPHFTSTRMAEIKKPELVLARTGSSGTSYTAGGNVDGSSHPGRQLSSSSKCSTQSQVPCDPTIPLLEKWKHPHKICTSMFTTALFIKSGNNPHFYQLIKRGKAPQSSLIHEKNSARGLWKHDAKWKQPLTK